jgi:hypothetical protein
MNTTTAATRRRFGHELRPRAWVLGGTIFLAGSIAITGAVAGVWAGLGLTALVLGGGLTLRSRRSPRQPYSPSGSIGSSVTLVGTPGASVDLLAAGLRHDLPMMAGLCRWLPSGGLPQAGLLAEHTYVVLDAVRQVMGSEVSPGGSSGLEAAAVVDQLAEVERRVGRLYSSELPGGLDDLDWHLARLWVVVDEYLSGPGPARGPIDWSLSHRRRARVLAWSASAVGVAAGSVLHGQDLRTRLWVRSGNARRARRRAGRLWGSESRAFGTGRKE